MYGQDPFYKSKQNEAKYPINGTPPANGPMRYDASDHCCVVGAKPSAPPVSSDHKSLFQLPKGTDGVVIGPKLAQPGKAPQQEVLFKQPSTSP